MLTKNCCTLGATIMDVRFTGRGKNSGKLDIYCLKGFIVKLGFWGKGVLKIPIIAGCL